MKQQTPWQDDSVSIARINDIIFHSGVSSVEALAEVRKTDLSIECLMEQAPLVTLWIKRYLNDSAWLKSLANIVEECALGYVHEYSADKLRKSVKWAWLEAVHLVMPYASAKLKKIYVADPAITFWRCYRGFDKISSLAGTRHGAFLDFSVNPNIPHQVLFDVATQCWNDEAFHADSEARCALAYVLFRRGAIYYHDRFKLADLDIERIDDKSRQFLYWGYISAALDHDEKVIDGYQHVLSRLLSEESAQTLIRVQAIDHDYSAEYLANMDKDDESRMLEKLKAPWAVLGGNQGSTEASFQSLIAACFPQNSTLTQINDINPREPMAWFTAFQKQHAAFAQDEHAGMGI